MAKCCVICVIEENDDELLLEAPCGRHWVCSDDVRSFFERATLDESLFPPKCCGQIFMLENYEKYVPFGIAWAYQVKERGEYAVRAKCRVYCASPHCSKFLHPSSHVQDPDTNTTYAVCGSHECRTLTCVKCKQLLDHGVQSHVCQEDEDEKKFRETAAEKGYQECSVCGVIVELIEACNHITCECSHNFCYICGKDWSGLHGCPQYGSATYDEEGYNQDGYHRDTGLSRDGLTRLQQIARDRSEDDSDGDDADNGNEEPDWEVLQHLTPEQRDFISNLPQEPREDALDRLRIELFETHGITFHEGFATLPPRDEDLDRLSDDEADASEEEFLEDYDDDEDGLFSFDLDDPGEPGTPEDQDNGQHADPILQSTIPVDNHIVQSSESQLDAPHQPDTSSAPASDGLDPLTPMEVDELPAENDKIVQEEPSRQLAPSEWENDEYL